MRDTLCRAENQDSGRTVTITLPAWLAAARQEIQNPLLRTHAWLRLAGPCLRLVVALVSIRLSA